MHGDGVEVWEGGFELLEREWVLDFAGAEIEFESVRLESGRGHTGEVEMFLGDGLGEFVGGIEQLGNKLMMSETFIFIHGILVDFIDHGNLSLLKFILKVFNGIELTNAGFDKTIKVPERPRCDYVG